MRILVVDDQENMCWILQRVLGQAGFEVHTATSAGESLAKAAAHEMQAAVIDYRLPDRDGISVLAELRKLNPGMAAVLMTSYGSAALCHSALQHGFTACLDKPFRNQDLLACLSAALGDEA